jgi:photosystem II stability/assembly factor-like uncharacterized protein
MLCLLFMATVWSQGQQDAQPSKPPINQSTDPILKEFRWRSIGPASMGGRIDDIEAVESNPAVYYVGFATGGLWKTVNNGTTFEPIFDTYPVSSIGDMAIFQADPRILWVGTGEPNNRQSSSFGGGMYKSTDAGATFAPMGLEETQTIARVVTNPKDANVVYVAALGHLYGPNKERGVYKTTDGGKSWANVKFIDENTGFTDLVMDPGDSRILYAASYQRQRTSWGFNGGGSGSGLWKTVDAGKSWTRLAGGLPAQHLGRIGLDVSRSNPNVLYAQIEVAIRGGARGGEGAPAQAAAGAARGAAAAGQRGGGRGAQEAAPPDAARDGVWRSDDKGNTWRIVSNQNNRAMYYSQIRVDPGNEQIVYTGGASFYKSTDGGRTFATVQGLGHSDHHAIWVDPKNGNHVLNGNDGGLNATYDQCATWEFIQTIPAGQFYKVGADMRKPYYIYGGLQDNGSWGGPSATLGGSGITNAEWFRVGGGDGFYCVADPSDHNTIYTESQNGAMSRYDLKMGRSTSIRPRAPGGGRGQQPAAAGPVGESESNIVPAPPAGEQYRWNWNTPIVMSPHNPRIIYTGANKFFKSNDRGDTWIASADLTRQIDRNTLPIMGVAGDGPMLSKNDGIGNYGNIITIAESPVLPGVLWVGTDDGNVQLSSDGGYTWKNVADAIPGLPRNPYQVSRVAPSNFDAGTCYVSIDGHRYDDMKPYVFVTRNFGATWTSIANNLPPGNVNVVLEDPKNRNLLYLGTEYAFFISLNGGAEWKRFMTGLPTVRIDDVIVHPRENDLILATHGRSVYIMDDITALQQLTNAAMSQDVILMNVRPATRWLQNIYLGRQLGRDKNFRGENPPPGAAISYYLKSPASGGVSISILDIDNQVVSEMTGPGEAGLHRVQWTMRPGGGRGGAAREGAPAAAAGGGAPATAAGGGGRGRGGGAIGPGVYRVRLTVGGKEFFAKVEVEDDPNR